VEQPDRIERRLKLRELRILLAVARAGSMVKAAAELNLSQPNISKAIADLELAFGVQLFDRNPKGVEPTTYGAALISRGTAVLDELRYAVKDVAFLADPTSGELRMGCGDFSASSVAMAIDRITRKRPGITFQVVSAEEPMLRSELRGRNIEFFLIGTLRSSFSEDEFDTEILYDDPLIVVADAQHPLARRRSIDLSELANQAWVLTKEATAAGTSVRDAFKGQGIAAPNTVVSTYSQVLRHNLLATGRFVTVIPKSMLRVMGKSLSVKALPVRLPLAHRSTAIIALKGRTLSPIAKLFVQTLRAGETKEATRG